MTYLSTGWTGVQMASMLVRGCKLSGKTDETNAAYDYLNMSQLSMFYAHDWSELLHQDDSFYTDGSESYDLTSELESYFGRVKAGSVRTGTYYLTPTSKYQWDADDPNRTYGGTPAQYCVINRTDFRIIPYGSNGDEIKLDWVALPVKIESSTVAADVSFKPEHQELIVQGGLWRMKRDYTQPDWQVDYKLYQDMLRDAKCDTVVNYSATAIEPVDC